MKVESVKMNRMELQEQSRKMEQRQNRKTGHLKICRKMEEWRTNNASEVRTYI